MSASTDPSGDRLALRRSLIRLASMVMLAMLAVALIGLFSVWSLARAHARSEANLSAYWGAIEQGLQVQLRFKNQVQAWKNLLIRGGDPAARAGHLDEFDVAEAGVVEAVNRVEALLGESGLTEAAEDVQRLREQHVQVGSMYRAALRDMLAASAPGEWRAEAIDARVRGIDRPVSQQIDALVEGGTRQMREMLDEQARSSRDRYSTLRWAQWMATLIAMVLVCGLVWRVLRMRGPGE